MALVPARTFFPEDQPAYLDAYRNRKRCLSQTPEIKWLPCRKYIDGGNGYEQPWRSTRELVPVDDKLIPTGFPRDPTEWRPHGRNIPCADHLDVDGCIPERWRSSCKMVPSAIGTANHLSPSMVWRPSIRCNYVLQDAWGLNDTWGGCHGKVFGLPERRKFPATFFDIHFRGPKFCVAGGDSAAGKCTKLTIPVARTLRRMFQSYVHKHPPLQLFTTSLPPERHIAIRRPVSSYFKHHPQLQIYSSGLEHVSGDNVNPTTTRYISAGHMDHFQDGVACIPNTTFIAAKPLYDFDAPRETLVLTTNPQKLEKSVDDDTRDDEGNVYKSLQKNGSRFLTEYASAYSIRW